MSDKAKLAQANDECPTTIHLQNTFTMDEHGAAISKEGCAQLLSALSGIQTVNALIFQAAIDKECTGGIALHHNVIVGLTNAVAVCADYSEQILSGHRFMSKAIKPDSAAYATLKTLMGGSHE